LDTHKNIKRRLLHEAVQDNLGMYPAVPLSHPVIRRAVVHRVRTGVGKMLLVAVAIVLLPVDDTSTLISTVIQQPGEIPIATMIEAPSEGLIATLTAPPTEALPQADESAPEPRLAALEPQHVEAPPVTLEAPLPASEDVGSAEPTFLAQSPST
jgi:hypothetical protein